MLFIINSIFCVLSFKSLFLLPFIFIPFPTMLCYFCDWYYLKSMKDLHPEFPKEFNIYGYSVSTSVAFPFSHQKSIIESNLFDPLYFIIRHKKVNKNLVVLSEFTFTVLYISILSYLFFMLLIPWHYETDTTQ